MREKVVVGGRWDEGGGVCVTEKVFGGGDGV